MVKRLPTIRETQVQPLGWEDLLEKKMATHSSILAWKIPWTEEPVGYSPWGHKELDSTERLHFHFSFLFFPKVINSAFLPKVKFLSYSLFLFSTYPTP